MTHPDPATFDRRTLVRTAATAAWTVPVVVVATASPALAASVPAGAPVMRFSTRPYAVPTIENAINVVATLSNTGPVEATSVLLVVTVTPGDLSDYTESTAVCDKLSTDPGFVLVARQGDPLTGGCTFTFASTHSSPPFVAYDQFEITVTLAPDEIGAGTVALRATPTPMGTDAVDTCPFTFSVLG